MFYKITRFKSFQSHRQRANTFLTFPICTADKVALFHLTSFQFLVAAPTHTLHNSYNPGN